MSNVDSILSRLGYPTLLKDSSTVMSNIISPVSNGSPSYMSNGEVRSRSGLNTPGMDFPNILQLCLVDFNVSPINIGGNNESDHTALINKPYTLIVGILNGTLPIDSILSVNGSDGTRYNINNITNPPSLGENTFNIGLVGEINVLSSVEQVVTYTISNNGQIDNSNITFKITWVKSLPPTKFITNPKCPNGTWSKIDISFTLDELYNPTNITPSPAVAAYNEMTNKKLNRFLGITQTLENWAKFLLFASSLSHGYSYNRICNISLTPDFTPSTISPTSILNLSFIISDINLGTEPELNEFDSILPNNKISHKCLGDWLLANFKIISDLIYIDKTNPENQQPLVMSVPATCNIENFTIGRTEVTIGSSSPSSPSSPSRPPVPFSPSSPSRPPVPFTPSNPLKPLTPSSSNSMIFIIVGVVILVLFFIFKSKKY